jgi:hypothetical protein
MGGRDLSQLHLQGVVAGDGIIVEELDRDTEKGKSK